MAGFGLPAVVNNDAANLIHFCRLSSIFIKERSLMPALAQVLLTRLIAHGQLSENPLKVIRGGDILPLKTNSLAIYNK